MENSISKNEIRKGIAKKKWQYLSLLIVLIIILIGSMVLSIGYGAVTINGEDIVKIVLLNSVGLEIGNAKELATTFIQDIVWEIRLPRILAALLVGASLATAGVIMQAIVRNPLAGPYVLGISSGASLGATLAVLLGLGSILGSNFIGIMAFIGALFSATLVYFISSLGGRMTSVKLILSGMAIGSLCSAFSSFIVYMADDAEGIRSITFWLMGSLAGAKWSEIRVVAIVIILALTFFLFQFRHLNMMLMGDEVAVSLGTNLNKYRKSYLIVVALIVGLSVYVAGMIGFVGLIIPHIVRMVIGTDHKRLLPISIIMGALFLIWSDIVARTIFSGRELPIGIVTSMIGAPIFIFLLVKKTYGFGRTNK